MRKRKNVVLLFSKVPETGLVKTRLSILKDGMFPPETASELYRCMLLDVVEIIGSALADLSREGADSSPSDLDGDGDGPASPDGNGGSSSPSDLSGNGGCLASSTGGNGGGPSNDDGSDNRCDGRNVTDEYELIISTTPAANVAAMRELLDGEEPLPWPVTVIADEGASFDEHYNHAFDQCWERGAECILSMGADMPALTKADIRYGFEQLHRLCEIPGGGIVVAPDQEMGVSVIGWTRETTFNHTGVFYNADGLTVLPAYIAKARAANLPALWLPPIPDIDTMADFVHNVTLVHALAYCAGFEDIRPARRTAEAMIDLGFREIRVAPNNLLDPRDEIDR